jgi:hypothetical protein
MRSRSSGDATTMSPPNREGNFDEYRMLIMETLKSLQEEIKGMRNDITEIKVSVGQLQVRAGLLGALGGAIGGAVISGAVAKMMG